MADRPVRPGDPFTPSSGASHGAAPVRMLQDRTQQFLRSRLANLFKLVWDEFFELSDNTDSVALQTQYLDTMKAMRLEKAAIESSLLNALNADYDALLSPDDGTDTVVLNSFSASGLKLVGNEELEEIIAFDAIVSRVQARCTLLLDRFARRVGHVQRRQFKARDMPIYPERLCDNFIKVVRPMSGGSRAFIALLKTFERCVLADLEGFLSESNDLLKGLGILPGLEEEKVRGKEKSATRKKNGANQPANRNTPAPSRRLSDVIEADAQQASGETAPAAPKQRIGTEQPDAAAQPRGPEQSFGRGAQPTQRSRQHAARLGTVSQLLANLQSSISPSASKPDSGRRVQPGTTAAEGAAALLDVLTEIRSSGKKPPQAPGAPAQSSTVRAGVRQQVEEHLASQGRAFTDLHPIDQTALELLDLLFAQWQQRDWAPGMLGELLHQVELPVAGIAMADPGFFDRQQHPARRLLNEIGSVATGFADAEQITHADPLYQKINQVVTALGEIQADTRQLSELLSDFIAYVETDRRRLAALEKRVLEEETATERVNAAHTAVEKLLRSRLSGKQIPLVVIDFVERAWSRVLFLSYLKYGVESDQWQGGVQLLEQLLDMIQSASPVAHERLANLLDMMRETLDDSGYEVYQSSQFLKNIAAFFDRERRREPEATAMPVILDPREAREIGNPYAIVEIDEVQADLPGEALRDGDDLAPQVDDDCLSQVDSIKKGSWVEFREESGLAPRRCRLIGVVHSTGKLIFGDRTGKKVAEGHRYRMAVMMKQGNLVVLDNSHLFDRAMEQVVEDLRRRRESAA